MALARPPAIDAIGYGNDWVGVASQRGPSPRPTRGGARSRRSPTPSPASSASTRAAALLFSWPVRLAPGETRRFAVRQPVAVARDRAPTRRHGRRADRHGTAERLHGRGVTPDRDAESRPRWSSTRHFYQPLAGRPVHRADLPPDPSAAPFRDWTARIDRRVLSPDRRARHARRTPRGTSGPTLDRLPRRRSAPDVLAAVRGVRRSAAAERGGPGIAQAFHHSILPLAAAPRPADRDRAGACATSRSGSAGRPRRSGCRRRPSTLPRSRVLAEDGVPGTILAPWQADAPHLDTRRPYRVDLGDGRHIAVAFYDGDLSGAVSFEPAVTADADRFARERIAPAPRRAPLPRRTSAADRWSSPATASSTATTSRSGTCSSIASSAPDADDARPRLRRRHPRRRPRRSRRAARTPEIRIRERTSWSCHHGVLRWCGECPDAPDGRWKAPLRERRSTGSPAASTRSRSGSPDAGSRGLGLDGIWAARDAYVDVVIGAVESRGALPPARLGAGASDEERRPGCWTCSRPSAGGWRCSRPTAGTGTIPGGPRRAQVLRCAARAVRLVDGCAGIRPGAPARGRPGLLRSPALGDRRRDDLPPALREVGQPPPGRVDAATVDGGAETSVANLVDPENHDPRGCPGVGG